LIDPRTPLELAAGGRIVSEKSVFMKSQELPAMFELVVCKDPDALAVRAAELVERSAQEAVAQRGRFMLGLAGGATPLKTYLLLAHSDRPTAIAWSKTHLFFSDERLVTWNDPRSNFGMVRKSLLARIKIPFSQVFAVPTRGHTAAEAAAIYAEKLARCFSPAEGGGPPRFDLILLGMGEDGHVASLFPRAPALEERVAWVTWSPPGTTSPLVDRITMTYPLLNAARHVVFLITGTKKAVALRDVLEGNPRPEDRPAAGVRPVDGRLTWLVDQEAAQGLTRRS
jgi:6-phosphogluconolactonase